MKILKLVPLIISAGLLLFAETTQAAQLRNSLLQRGQTAGETSLLHGTIAQDFFLGSAFANPAHLNNNKYSNALLTIEETPYDARFLTGMVAYRHQLPIAIQFGSIILDDTQVYNDTGDSSNANFSNFYLGAGTAYSFKWLKHTFEYGGALKFAQQSIGDSTFSHGLLDAGIKLDTKIEALRLRKSRALNNFSFGLSVLNAGTPALVSEQVFFPPMSVNFGTLQRLYYTGKHGVDLFYGASVFPLAEADFSQELNGSFGTQYTFDRYIRARLGTEINAQTTSLVAGWGIVYNRSRAYHIAFDYATKSDADFSLSHVFTVHGSYNFDSPAARVKAESLAVTEAKEDVNQKLLKVVQKGINAYILENGDNPNNLRDVIPFLKEFGWSELPRPNGGIFSYDKTTAIVTFVDHSNLQQYNESLVLKDDSEIFCNINKENATELECTHIHGVTTIKKKDIKVRNSSSITNIDNQIIAAMQDYIYKYRSEHNKNPKNLKTLTDYIREKHGKVNIPKLLKGKLEYDPDTGVIRRKGTTEEEIPDIATFD